MLQVLKNGAVSTLAIIDGIKQRVAELRGRCPTTSASPSWATSRCSLKARSPASSRGCDRRHTDQPDDPAVPRQLAIDHHHRDVHPARHLCRDRDAGAAGETLNIMTLGGLALAVGILVDDATVTIENINWHLEQGKGVVAAITDGAQQIAAPGVRVDALHLHRVRADVLPRRGAALPVRAMALAVMSQWPGRTFCRALWCRQWPPIFSNRI